MRLIVSTKRPCRLDRGEVRRVPQRPATGLVGYHLCCPRCGFVNAALVGDAGLAIAEGAEEYDLTFSRAIRCTYCRVIVRVQAGEVSLEEDQDVRNVRYR